MHQSLIHQACGPTLLPTSLTHGNGRPTTLPARPTCSGGSQTCPSQQQPCAPALYEHFAALKLQRDGAYARPTGWWESSE